MTTTLFPKTEPQELYHYPKYEEAFDIEITCVFQSPNLPHRIKCVVPLYSLQEDGKEVFYENRCVVMDIPSNDPRFLWIQNEFIEPEDLNYEIETYPERMLRVLKNTDGFAVAHPLPYIYHRQNCYKIDVEIEQYPRCFIVTMWGEARVFSSLKELLLSLTWGENYNIFFKQERKHKDEKILYVKTRPALQTKSSQYDSHLSVGEVEKFLQRERHIIMSTYMYTFGY